LDEPEDQPDHDDDADDVEDVHSRSPIEVAPHIVRIIVSLQLERRVRCSKGDSSASSASSKCNGSSAITLADGCDASALFYSTNKEDAARAWWGACSSPHFGCGYAQSCVLF